MLANETLIDLLKKAYSAEKAAAFAYQGHAGSVKKKEDKESIRQIEIDEWNHREAVKTIMDAHNIPVSKWYELKFHVVGKTISASCYLIGWFMPYYFAGNLESGNVCEYIRIKRLFNDKENSNQYDDILCEMSIKEKEHEVYFYERIKNKKALSVFEKIFHWGKKSKNDIDLEKGFDQENANDYCKGFGEK